MRATEENKEELLRQYIKDIYDSSWCVIPKQKPSIETLKRYSHQYLVSLHSLTLEYILRIRKECNILIKILNNQPFEPYNIEDFDKNFNILAEKAKERAKQEYLEKKEARKKFAQYGRVKKEG